MHDRLTNTYRIETEKRQIIEVPRLLNVPTFVISSVVGLKTCLAILKSKLSYHCLLNREMEKLSTLLQRTSYDKQMYRFLV